MKKAVRGTQSLVVQMAWVFKRPSLTAMEVAWRWIFGIPLMVVCLGEARRIFAALPPDVTGLSRLDSQNPWIAAVQLADAWSQYQPHMAAVLRWLLPAAAVAWAVCSAVGRNLVLKRMERGLRFRPLGMTALQGSWLLLFAATFWAWFRLVAWAAATHITSGGEPDLVGYLIWVIFLSLGFFTLWALISWAFFIAPLLMLLEKRPVLSALGQSFRLGKTFTAKLVEVNLVMGIVKLALIVVAMVLAAAPLPFSDELGAGAMRVVYAGATVVYLLASDYFHVVRLRGVVALWRELRGPAAGDWER